MYPDLFFFSFEISLSILGNGFKLSILVLDFLFFVIFGLEDDELIVADLENRFGGNFRFESILPSMILFIGLVLSAFCSKFIPCSPPSLKSAKVVIPLFIIDIAVLFII